MSKTRTIAIVLLVFVLSTACLSFGGLGEKALDMAMEKADLPEGALETAQVELQSITTQVADTIEDSADKPATSDSPYPMPADVENVMNVAGTVNFQTSLSLEAVAAFYRQALSAEGYTERTVNTVEDENVVSLVFDGHPSGQALVVQAVSLGEITNVNVRLEDV